MQHARSAPVLLFLAALAGATPQARAKDYGQEGAVFPITEEDFLKVLERRLRTLEATGEIARLNRQMADKVKADILSPRPIAGIAPASQRRTWLFDPSIEVAEDIRDEAGRLIARKGTRVNPLDHVGLRQKLVFLDGREEAQVRWALGWARPEAVKLILVGGSAFGLMETHKRRFYFDQGGVLTSRFGITRVPATIAQEGRLLRIREIPVASPAGEARP